MRLVDHPAITHIVAIDLCRASLTQVSQRLAKSAGTNVADVQLIHGSMLDAARQHEGFDCALLIETIEHIDPDRLSALEQAVFVGARPICVVITTPNAEFNLLLGVPTNRFRHPDHRFEWGRDKFRRWAGYLAERT